MMASQSHASAPAHDASPANRVLIWDAPVRVFHWLAALCFAGAWLTAETDALRGVHITLGYTLAGLIAFRLAWGVTGTRHARFASFLRGPRAVACHLRSILRNSADPSPGHNPAGAIGVIVMLALALITTVLGWASYNELGGHWLEETHEAAATAMLVLVGVHIVAVVGMSLLQRENLARAMLSGRKRAAPEQAISAPHAGIALLVAAAVLGFWLWQWHSGAIIAASASATEHRDGHDDDHDDERD